MLPAKQGLYNPDFEHDNCGAGFICSLKGVKSNNIIHKALQILEKLEHRGAVNADGKTGDGAGILIDIPHDFFVKNCEFNLPKEQAYAVSNVFLPKRENQRKFCIEIFEKHITEQGLDVIGWRDVPVDESVLGKIAALTQPFIKQIFIGKSNTILDDFQFNLKLFIARKKTEHEINSSKISEMAFFYLPSLHHRTLIYKGLLIPEDIDRFYLDLSNPKLVTRLALVHQRFSTNTFPTWDLAQPFRYMCHNGEINTRRGNVTRMNAREELMKSDFIGKDLLKVFPTILDGKSDSSQMDMVVEILLTTGRSLPEVMMMMVPEAWEKHKSMSDEKKAFYEFNSCIMEPWDGPASIPFTDGKFIGAMLDRNGLRPSRYSVTKDGYVIMSSETGVVDIEPSNVEKHGRLEPGKMFLVDMIEGRIIEDEEIKNEIVSKHPYRKWLNQNTLPLMEVPYTGNKTPLEKLDFETRLRIFGYTEEDLKTIILPMCVSGKEAMGSMGTDTPLAVLSNKPQLLFNYFKQLFAQVTNPPLDGIREEIVTDTSLGLGSDYNIYDIVPDHCKKLKINNPIISNEDLDKIKFIKSKDFKSASISALYDVDKGLNELERTLIDLVKQASKAIDQGGNIIILSDRGVSKKMAPIPALLACSFVNHELYKIGKRARASLIIESAEPREVHHFALLFGFGASAVNPYIVNEIVSKQVKEQEILGFDYLEAINNYNKAVGLGILKVMNKIGISTLNSYRGSQLFECIGLNTKIVNQYFPNTVTRIQGIGLREIEREICKRHTSAYNTDTIDGSLHLDFGGQYRWRRNGERHLFNPTTISKLQQAVRLSDQDSYNVYAEAINEQAESLMTIRGLFEFDNLDPIPLEEVEDWTEIVKRFKTGAMSYGSISKEAHENSPLP